MKYKIFVDGQFGTTGLKIHEMLKDRTELEILTIKEEDKKDIEIKKKFLTFLLKHFDRYMCQKFLDECYFQNFCQTQLNQV
jgi:N-acetyl-gamma-glutamylphosphate reductase